MKNLLNRNNILLGLSCIVLLAIAGTFFEQSNEENLPGAAIIALTATPTTPSGLLITLKSGTGKSEPIHADGANSQTTQNMLVGGAMDVCGASQQITLSLEVLSSVKPVEIVAINDEENCGEVRAIAPGSATLTVTTSNPAQIFTFNIIVE
jgi:hypothetical protein